MTQLIENPLSLALGWTLLHFLWQGCLIALIAKLLLSAFHKTSSNARYAIACAAFAAMTLAPCFTFRTIRQQASIVGEWSSEAVESNTIANEEFASASLPVTSGRSASQIAIRHSDATEPDAKSDKRDTVATAFRSLTLANVGSLLRPLLPWLVVAWFGGVCLLSIRLVVSWRMLRRLKTTGLQKVSEFQQRVFKELCDAFGVRRVVRIAHSGLVEVPTLVGWLQPIVLLPMSAMSGLEQSQLRALLAHELAHVRRADFAVNLLQTVIETLLFYHPAVWWLSARIRQERENCCDDLAVAECRDGRSYVEALLRMEQLRGVAAPLAISARGGSLTQRAARLLQPNGSHRRAGLRPPAGAAFFSLLLLAIGAITVTSVLPGGETEAAGPIELAAAGESSDEWKDGEVMPEQVINEVPENVLAHAINIVGQAKDLDGEPVAGATIYVASHGGAFYKLLKTTTTDKNGKYAFRELKLPLEKADDASSIDWGQFEIYGTADDYAFAWRGQKGYCPDMRDATFLESNSPDDPGHFEGDERIRIDFEFARPAPLSGTIVDENGNPIPKTKVHLFNCWRAPTEKFSDSDMFQVHMSSLYSSSYCPPKVSTVRTNDRGEFVFRNAPPECRYRISVKPPGFASRMMYATTESDGPAQRKGSTLERDGMQLVFESPREVRIQLVGLAKPRYGDGAIVASYNKSASSTDVSNKDGVATMKIPPGEYNVEILPPINTPYWVTQRKITVTKEKIQSFELEMIPAAVVDIQVVNESGEPVEGAPGFDLWVENKNGGQRDIHYFRDYERDTRTCHVHRVRTDEKGQMRANFLPGKYRIGVGKESLPDGWRVVDRQGKEVDLRVGEPTKVTFRVRPADNGDF